MFNSILQPTDKNSQMSESWERKPFTNPHRVGQVSTRRFSKDDLSHDINPIIPLAEQFLLLNVLTLSQISPSLGILLLSLNLGPLAWSPSIFLFCFSVSSPLPITETIVNCLLENVLLIPWRWGQERNNNWGENCAFEVVNELRRCSGDLGQCSAFRSGLGCPLLKVSAPKGRLCTSVRWVLSEKQANCRVRSSPEEARCSRVVARWHLSPSVPQPGNQLIPDPLRRWNSPVLRTGFQRSRLYILRRMQSLCKGCGYRPRPTSSFRLRMALLPTPSWKWLW